MAKFVCKNQVRNNKYSFLMCKALLPQKGSVTDVGTAAQAYCLHQAHCNCSQQAENTESAKNCKYLNQSR